MSKKIVQDVVPPNERSIRRVPIPPKKHHVSAGKSGTSGEEKTDSSGGGYFDRTRALHRRQRGRSKYKVWVFAGICLIVLAFLFSGLFAGSNVEVVPRNQNVSVDASLTAIKNSGGSDLGFDIMQSMAERGIRVEAGEEEEVSRRASGEIVIYNNHGPESQILIGSTRFETPEGLIYRIEDTVTVPGQTTDEEGNTIPGSLNVTVYADSPGEEYNIGLTDFTIPGFQGDPRFETFYARSETSMTGGFVGVTRIVGDQDLELARTELQTQLMDQLKKDVRSQAPDNFLLYDEGFFFEFEELPQSNTQDDSVQINEKGTVSVVLIDRAELSHSLIREMYSDNEDGLPNAQVANIDNLEFEVVDQFSPAEDEELGFNLSGQARVIWVVDRENIRIDLAGQSRRDLERVMENYPSVQRAEAVIRPFWKRSFPGNPDSISIEVSLD